MRSRNLIIVLVAILVVLAGLGVAGAALGLLAWAAVVPVASAGEVAQVEIVEEYAIALDGTGLVTDDYFGVAFAYPEGFSVTHSNEYSIIVTGPVPQVGTPAQLILNVRDAGGRTAADEADWKYNDVRFLISEEMDVRRSTLTLGGIDAVQIDGLPGAQDMNRQVLVVRGDRLYELMFVPMDPTYPDIIAQVEHLYSTVIESFTFTSD